MIKRNILLILVPLFLVNCKDKKEQVEQTLPSNLEVNISYQDFLVTIQASATNANYYSFMFFFDSDSAYYESQDGLIEHSFDSPGSYSVRIRAHSSFSDYSEIVEPITINNIPVVGEQPPSAGYSSPLSYPGYSLVWNDEFEGNTLSSDWVFEIGNGNWGWGNNELQYYLEENVSVENGVLTITAKNNSFNTFDYTSSRIKTQGNQSFKYGRIDVRAALPFGQGIWPAIWMLGDNFSSAGWPNCGEIDIVELVGGSGNNDKTIYGTLHWEDNGHSEYGGSNSIGDGKFADEWHVFSIIWDQNQIRFLRDDVQYHAMNITGPQLTEFHQNFFFIMNVAIGGNWPGSPNSSTIFPQRMFVDYIRVFQ